METVIDWLGSLSNLELLFLKLALLLALVFELFRRGRERSILRRRLDILVRGGEIAGLDLRGINRVEAMRGEPGDLHDVLTFHFRFDGEGSVEGSLLRNKEVSLVFGQGLANTLLQALSFSGQRFSALSEDDARLTITIWPDKGLEPRGLDAAVARFKKGRLLEEVKFPLFVEADSPDEVPLTAEFYVGGTKIYGLTFVTRVGEAGKEPTNPQPNRSIDLDQCLDLQAAMRGYPGVDRTRGELLLKLDLLADGVLFNLLHTSPDTGTVPVGYAMNRDLDRGSLQTLLVQLRGELGPTFYSSGVWDRATLAPLSGIDAEDLSNCFEHVASAGSILNTVLRGKSADVKALFDYIESQPAGTRLTIATSKVFLPFEILYPHSFSKDLPVEERLKVPVSRGEFWGSKFALEVSYASAGDSVKLIRTHLKARHEVSLNLNQSIKGNGSPSPMQIHEELERDLRSRGIACASHRSCDEMKRVLLGAATDASLVYVYCHGSAADAVAGSLEELQLDEDPCVVRPGSMYGIAYKNAPIIFLNACYGGATSPLFFTGFLESYRNKGALGLIATNFPVPIMFGARFGADVVTECLVGTGGLGERVRQLRLGHAQDGNPVPLFYSVQCQLAR